MKTVTNSFLMTSAFVLGFLGLAKAIHALSDAHSLDLRDPVFGFSVRMVLVVAAVVELSVSTALIVNRDCRLRLGLITWLCVCFLTYRGLRAATGFVEPCGCLGEIGTLAGLSPKTEETVAVATIGYLFMGSVVLLAYDLLTTGAGIPRGDSNEA